MLQIVINLAAFGEKKAMETKKLSKNQLKKMAKGTFKEKKEKMVVVPAKKKAAVAAVVFENPTKIGEKKDVNDEMQTSYHPQIVEAAWQEWWMKKGYFECDIEKLKAAKPSERFVMIFPPPNVTGSLHLGHGLTVAIQDTLTRWHRMLGHATLWVPGTDHAGIATQSVVEKRLLKEENVSRHDLGREKFLEKVWDWKDQYESRIHHQFKMVGCSAAWGKQYFSMDENVTKAVVECFNTLWEDGLIYRATRMINWSCKLKTALSEIEVDYIDIEKRTKLAVPGHNPEYKYEFGVLTSFGYTLENSDEQVIVATTRLETMLGDSAVAIHPEDERYKHLHGKFLKHPFCDRRIPIVLDAELVDMAFGTGCVKITPAHDPNDYLCGKRHNLEFITVISDDGAMNENAGQFNGIMRYDARVAVEKALIEIGQFHGKVDNKMRLGLCSRSGDVIEPMIKPQWFVNCQEMANDAMEAVRSKELTILPEIHEKTWFRWLENIRDWCISRQLWWGHRIPAYYVTVEGEEWIDPNSNEGEARWFAGRSELDARQKAAQKLNVDIEKLILKQDEDVLDTWVSAGLFPFAVFGWPDNKDEVSAYYPTDLLETGHDILFFWVARMVFMGQKLTGKLPFHTIYLHSMVRDKYGRKMSKSLGNVIDPLEIIHGCTLDALVEKVKVGNLSVKEIEKATKAQIADFPDGIPECGADALRFGLLSYTSQGRDINLDIHRLVGYRQFCNKLWNATKFAMSHLGTSFEATDNMEMNVLDNPVVHIRDQFILHRLNQAIIKTNEAFENYNFGDATTAIHHFWLYDLCDVYLETLKPIIRGDDKAAILTAQQTLFICLETGLRLLHPVMPFITEELWQRLPGSRKYPSITISPFPKAISKWDNPSSESSMTTLKDVVHAARSVRAEYSLAHSVQPQFFIRCATQELKDTITAQTDDFCTLAKAGDTVAVQDDTSIPNGCAIHSINETIQLFVQLRGLVDFDVEIKKLEKKIAKIDASMASLNKKINASDYTTKVPEKVQVANTVKLQAFQTEHNALSKAISDFERLR